MSLLQEYIYPIGQNACVTRLIYHTKHNKEMKANFGYKLRNKLMLHEKNEKIELLNMATLNKSRVNSFSVNKLNGTSLRELEVNASELINYLERAYPIRINRIVLDFITNPNKIHYLFNVKSIDIDYSPKLLKDVGDKKRTLDELT